VSAVNPEQSSFYTTSRPAGSTFRIHNGPARSRGRRISERRELQCTFVADDGFGGTDTKSVAISVVEKHRSGALCHR
jgi:hypothetical protein